MSEVIGSFAEGGHQRVTLACVLSGISGWRDQALYPLAGGSRRIWRGGSWSTGPDILTLEDEIERLDRDIINLGVPMKHSDLYFMIKSHLNLVRIRIGVRHADLRGDRTTARLVR